MVPFAGILKRPFCSRSYPEKEKARQCFAVMGSVGWFENLGAETEVRERESCSEVKWIKSHGLIWCVNQRPEEGEL